MLQSIICSKSVLHINRDWVCKSQTPPRFYLVRQALHCWLFIFSGSAWWFPFPGRLWLYYGFCCSNQMVYKWPFQSAWRWLGFEGRDDATGGHEGVGALLYFRIVALFCSFSNIARNVKTTLYHRWCSGTGNEMHSSAENATQEAEEKCNAEIKIQSLLSLVLNRPRCRLCVCAINSRFLL